MRVLRRGVRCVLAAWVVFLVAAPAHGQESRSSQLAAEAAKLLDAAKLGAVAAKLGADEYVGALYFAGSQLLVVKARYIVPERMDAQLAAKNYRDVYIDLNSASVAGSKTLVADFGANGLQPRRRDNQAPDTVDVGGRSHAFDGDWGKAKLSEQEYMKIFQTTDGEYVRMLEALVAQLKSSS
jgi:hypothetical protein